MRNYRHIDAYLDQLEDDIYGQPPDDGHKKWARRAIAEFGHYFDECETVLDVGCGSGFSEPFWQALGLRWTGVTLGHDANAAKVSGRDIRLQDMSFLDLPDEAVDIVFARHVLEHSPFPLLTLMEWRRVAKKFLLLVAPAPEHWGYRGRNHYAVLEKDQLLWLCLRAGWKLAGASTMLNHNPEYLDTMPDKAGRANALAVHPPLEVEYRLLFAAGQPEVE